MKYNVLYLFLIVIVSYVLFSLQISGIEVFMLDEAKNATCAREMMERKDFIVPTFNHILRTDKPPLHYYFMIGAYNIFGFGAFAARFFSAVFGVLTIAITFLFARKVYDTKTAWWSTIILLSSLHFIFEFHLAVPDPYLIFFINAALFSFLLFFQFHHNHYLWFFYIALALGFLTKGPVAVALPVLIILVFMILTKSFRRKTIKDMKPLWGMLLFLLIAAPWYMLVSIKTNMAWTEGFFLKHNLERYTDTMQGHGGIYFLSVVFLLIGLLPFSVLLIQSMVYALKKRKHRDYFFLFIYIVVFTLFFSLSDTQLPNYIMPVYPACAILIGRFLVNANTNMFYRYKTGLSLWAGLVISLLIPVGIYVGVDYDANLKGMNYLAYYLVPMPLAFIISLIYFYRERFYHAFKALAAGFLIVNILLFGKILPAVSEKSIANDFLNSRKSHYTLVSYKRINPSFIFYFQGNIPVYHDLQSLEAYLENEANYYLITRRKYKKQLLDKFPELEVEKEREDLFEGHTTTILMND